MDSIFFLKTWINHHCPHLFFSDRYFNYSEESAESCTTALAAHLASASERAGVTLNKIFYFNRSYLWPYLTYRQIWHTHSVTVTEYLG